MGYFILCLIVGIICGFITKSMNESKGYDGGFAWGFFLAIIGIIVVAVRPYAKSNNASQGYGNSGNFAGGAYGTSYETARPLKAAPHRIAYCLPCKKVFIDDQFCRCPQCGGYSTVKTNISEQEWNIRTEEWKLQKKAEWFGIDLKQEFAPTFREKIKGTEFEQYLPILEKNNLIEPSLLFSLTSEDLKEIGIESLGDRKRLLAFIKDFNLESTEDMTSEVNTENLPREDDWICPSCGVRNRSYMATCPDCLRKRPQQ